MDIIYATIQGTKATCYAWDFVCLGDAHEGAGTWIAGIASLIVGAIALFATALPIWRANGAAKKALVHANKAITRAGENFYGEMPDTEHLQELVGDMQVTEGMLSAFIARTDEPHLVVRLLEMRGIVVGAMNTLTTLVVTHRYPGMDAAIPNAEFAALKNEAAGVLDKI